MSNIKFFTKEDLELWLHSLEESGNGQYLPPISEQWFDKIMDSMELLQFPYHKQTIYNLGARPFYAINHGHKFENGNKRSAIIVLYLFCVTNGYLLGETNWLGNSGIRSLAKRVAKSSGRRQEKWIQIITEELKAILSQSTEQK